MHDEGTVPQMASPSNIIAIGANKKMRQRKFMERLFCDAPGAGRDADEDVDVVRIILAFDHMDQEQARQFYMMLSEMVSTRSRKLVRECLKELLHWNSTLLPGIEEMAAGILMNDGGRQPAGV